MSKTSTVYHILDVMHKHFFFHVVEKLQNGKLQLKNFLITDYCFLLLIQIVQKLHTLMKSQEMTTKFVTTFLKEV